MKVLNRFLFVITLLLFVTYFIVSLIASFYAITQGWGISILALFAAFCLVNLLLTVYIKLKHEEKINKSLSIISMILLVVLILLAMKSMIGVNKEIEIYNTIKNFSN